jgi:ankyrin repeat protein
VALKPPYRLQGREAIAKPLLTQDGVDSDFKSDMGRTLLPRPAANEYEAVVKLMLDTGKANTEAKDTRYGRTSLLWAAENGYEAVVELLLGKDGV